MLAFIVLNISLPNSKILERLKIILFSGTPHPFNKKSKFHTIDRLKLFDLVTQLKLSQWLMARGLSTPIWVGDQFIGVAMIL